MKKLASKGLLMSALICGNVLWGGTTVLANEVQEYELDEMVVTATRTMKQIQEVPSSVSLRGFGSTNVLVLVDGVQQNDTYEGSVNFNSIPVENIERIEVVRGAGSSIYGGHAVGGVINITTKEAKAGTHIDAAVSYGSYKTWKKSLNVNAKVNDKWSFGLGFENRKADGFDGYYNTAKASAGKGQYTANLPTLSDGSYVYGGRGTSDWDHKTYTANLKYNFDDSKSLKYSYTKYKTYFGYKNPYSFVKDANGNPVYSGSVTTQHGNVINIKASNFYGYNNIKERDTHALAYKDEANKFNASFSYLNDKKSGFTSASVPKTYPGLDWDGAGSYSSHPGKIYNFNMEKAWENVGKHTIVVGANFKQEEMVQDRYTLKHWKDENSKDSYYAHDKGKVQNFALFVQDEYKMSDPVTMYLGARLDYYKKCEGVFWNTTTSNPLDTTSPSETHIELSPKVAFDYKADDKTNYFISYGHSFNPPAMYKMYRYSEYSKYWYVPNPDLKPETSDTFELGMKKELDKDTNFNVTLYHVKTDDKIAASGILPGETYMGKGVKKYMNFDSEKRNGVEFELTHKISDKFDTYINYAWQQGKLKLGGKESTNFDIPKHLLHAGIEYNYDKWNALLDCQYVSARQAPDEEGGEYGAEDAYFIINTAVNYKIAKDVTLQFGVTNLLDREFYSGDATGGRTYNVGLRYSF